MYHFTKAHKTNQFFFFEKHLIENMNWARLPKASKAIYPVIRSYCDRNGAAFPGEETMAALSGRTEKVVREGIRGLKGFPGIQIEAYTSKRGRSSKRFLCKLPKYGRGVLFPFHRERHFRGGQLGQAQTYCASSLPCAQVFWI
jgi:hypothetical protein